jgi:hypothetical protein
MKKSEKFIAVNNQEDEDGYILYPLYAIYGGHVKDTRTVSDLPKPANSASDSIKPGPGKLTRSAAAKAGKGKE